MSRYANVKKKKKHTIPIKKKKEKKKKQSWSSVWSSRVLLEEKNNAITLHAPPNHSTFLSETFY